MEIQIISEREELDVTHVILELKFENKDYVIETVNGESNELDVSLDSQSFFSLFPFHMVISESLTIISAGDSLTQLFPSIVSELLRDMFSLVR